MTQEEKELLLKDLCARLPYEVEVFYSTTIPFATLITINAKKADCIVYDHSEWDRHTKFRIEDIKPYLRPMSSMTDNEAIEYLGMLNDIDKSGLMNQNFITKVVDWLDKKMFDHRGLISIGLALEAPEDMYKINI